MNDKKRAVDRGVIILIFVIALFGHLYRLGEIPFGINVDEMGMGYDAFCLGNYGIDRYFNSFPVYLTNYGGGQSALYAYLDILPIKIFGLNAAAIRLVGVFMYAAAVFFGYRTYLLVQEKGKAVFYLFLTAILPVYVMLFRIGMDCNLMLAVSTIFFYFVIKASDTGAVRYFILSGVTGGLVLYTYAVSYIVMPVFLLCWLGYMIWMKRIHVKHVLALGIPLAVLAFPLILVQIVNMLDRDSFRLGIFTITRLSNYRSGEISIKNISLSSAAAALKSIFGYDILRYNSLPEFGTIYYLSIPFALAGVIRCICVSLESFKKRIFCREYLYLCWFAVVFFIGCCTVANTNKMNAAFLSVTYFIVEGVFWCASWLGTLLKKKKDVIIGVITGLYAVSAVFFFIYYFGGQYRADYDNMEFFSYSFREPLAYAMEDDELSRKIIYMSAHEQTYPYFLEATQMSPYEYREAVKSGKYRFSIPEDIDYEANYIIPDTDEDIKARFEEAGFDAYEFEHYTLYSYDMSSYSVCDAHIEWNAGVDAGGHILQSAVQEVEGEMSYVLVGWSYNEQNHALWDEVYITSGDEKFYAQKVAREDLQETIGDSSLIHCGLLFIIPADKMPSGADAVVTCIDKADCVTGTMHLDVE